MQLDLRRAIWGSIGGFFGDIVGIGLGYGMTLAAGQVTSQVTAEMMRAESQIAYIAPSFTMDNFIRVRSRGQLTSGGIPCVASLKA